eukprot:TRINITY_DN900_c0_g1_i6.p1 TRINITY_DN900_c0_g1~~TRINITY_DN900_c0_g1_i6.p1  ORF type:complete len:871 (+),score=254.23 TRINITY_DN900_c0_g1_i6:79-2691(+)
MAGTNGRPATAGSAPGAATPPLRRPPLPVPAEARAYVLEHGLHALFNDLMDEILRNRPRDPAAFIAAAMLRRTGRSAVHEDCADLRDENAHLRRVITYSQPPAKGRAVDAELAAARKRIADLEHELAERRRAQPQDDDPLAAFLAVLPQMAPHPMLLDRALSEIMAVRHGMVHTVQPPGSGKPPSFSKVPRHEALGAMAPSALCPSALSPAVRNSFHGLTPGYGIGLTPHSTPQRAHKTLTIVHFNDVYHTDGFKKEPVGSAARFATALAELSSPLATPHVLFSGDAFSPSITATVTQGAHMPPVLNQLAVEAACVGNHDLDFGVDRLEELVGMCRFPWLLTNVLDENGGQLAGSKSRIILKWDGVRVGLLGIVEKAWIDTCGCLPSSARYVDMVQAAREGVELLRLEGAHVVVALTHMRTPNDKVLAEARTGVDVILGGHDHDYEHFVAADTHVVKSGADFKHFSVVSLIVPGLRMLEGHSHDIPVDVQVRKFDVTSEYEKDEDMCRIVKENEEAIHQKLSVPCAISEVPIDARFSTVRTQEAAIGNWITDIVRWHYNHVNVECCVLQGGCMRADRHFDAGTLTVGDILAIVPIEDPMIVIEVGGDDIIASLNSATSRYPALEGRFPQVSGLKFKFDPRRPGGARVEDVQILVRGTEGQWADVRPQARYRLATSDYLARGNDGYDVFAKGDRIVDCEQGIILPVLVRRFLFLQRYGETLKTLKGFRGGNSAQDAVRRAGQRAMGNAGILSIRKKAVDEKARTLGAGGTGMQVTSPQDCELQAIPRVKSGLHLTASGSPSAAPGTAEGGGEENATGSSAQNLSPLLASPGPERIGSFNLPPPSPMASDMSIATIRPSVEGRIIRVADVAS